MNRRLAAAVPAALFAFFALPADGDASNPDGWRQVESDAILSVYTSASEGHKVLMMKTVTDLPAPIAKVVTVFRDAQRRHEWVDRLADHRVLKDLTSFSRLEYNRTEMPWPIRDRDFIYVSNMEIQPERKLVVFSAKSVDEKEYAFCEKCVRGTILQSRFELTPSPDGRSTHAEVYLHIDPEGSVPKWLVNWVQKRIPRNTVKRLAEQLRKPDIIEYPLPGPFREY